MLIVMYVATEVMVEFPLLFLLYSAGISMAMSNASVVVIFLLDFLLLLYWVSVCPSFPSLSSTQSGGCRWVH